MSGRVWSSHGCMDVVCYRGGRNLTAEIDNLLGVDVLLLLVRTPALLYLVENHYRFTSMFVYERDDEAMF
jgi:hypothetical protein